MDFSLAIWPGDGLIRKRPCDLGLISQFGPDMIEAGYWALNTKEDAAQSGPMGMCRDQCRVRTCSSLTVLNPDFGG